MLTRAAGPDWSANIGEELNLPMETAAGLVSGGYAVPLDIFPKNYISCLETAAVDPAPERAVRPAAKAKKR